MPPGDTAMLRSLGAITEIAPSAMAMRRKLCLATAAPLLRSPHLCVVKHLLASLCVLFASTTWAQTQTTLTVRVQSDEGPVSGALVLIDSRAAATGDTGAV